MRELEIRKLEKSWKRAGKELEIKGLQEKE